MLRCTASTWGINRQNNTTDQKRVAAFIVSEPLRLNDRPPVQNPVLTTGGQVGEGCAATRELVWNLQSCRSMIPSHYIAPSQRSSLKSTIL